MPEQKLIHKRRLYYINKKFQKNFIIKFCLLIILSGVLTTGLLYLLAMKSTTVSIVDSRVVVRTTADYLLPILIQTVAVVMVIIGAFTIWISMIFSHRIAGPLYRFKKVMQSLAEGNFTSDFKIRDTDQLQDLADEFNIMIRKVREELTAFKNTFKTLKTKLDASEEAGLDKDSIKELKKVSDDLNKILSYFKS